MVLIDSGDEQKARKELEEMNVSLDMKLEDLEKSAGVDSKEDHIDHTEYEITHSPLDLILLSIEESLSRL